MRSVARSNLTRSVTLWATPRYLAGAPAATSSQAGESCISITRDARRGAASGRAGRQCTERICFHITTAPLSARADDASHGSFTRPNDSGCRTGGRPSPLEQRTRSRIGEQDAGRCPAPTARQDWRRRARGSDPRLCSPDTSSSESPLQNMLLRLRSGGIELHRFLTVDAPECDRQPGPDVRCSRRSPTGPQGALVKTGRGEMLEPVRVEAVQLLQIGIADLAFVGSVMLADALLQDVPRRANRSPGSRWQNRDHGPVELGVGGIVTLVHRAP